VGDEVCGADGTEVEVGGGFANGLVGLEMLREGDESAVGAEDSGFFAGDLGDGVAEVVLVVEGDVSDDREEGVDDVGGVKTASKPNFEDGYIYRFFSCFAISCEVLEGEGGEDFEEAGWVGEIAGFNEEAGGFVDLEVEAGEVFVRDLDAIDLDAFVDADQVRRGVETCAVAGCCEDAGQGGGGGAFAVGSGDQDGGEGVLRVAEGCGEDAHVGEVKLAAGGAGWGRGELMAQGVEMVDRGSVRHAAILGDSVGFGGGWLRAGDRKVWSMTLEFGAYH